MFNSLKKNLFVGLIAALTVTGCGSNISSPDLLSDTSANLQNEDVTVSNTHYKLIEIIGIGDVYQKKLNDNGIKYTDQLLSAGAKRIEREKLAAKTGISTKLILRWVNHIDLMRIKGIGPKQSNWLEATGVDSIPELAKRNAQNLHDKLAISNKIDASKNFVDRMVSLKTVQSWIDTAKKTTPSVVVGHEEE